MRICKECKKQFANPDSIRAHKRVDGACRTDEALLAVGFTMTPKGWIRPRIPLNSRR